METLIKINIAITLFYLVYRLCYNDDTFFALRRIVLLSAIGLSLLYPFIDLSSWFRNNETIVEFAYAYQEVVVTPFASEETSLFDYLLYGYLVISAFILIRLILQITQIVILRFKSKPLSIFDINIFTLVEKQNPFSFFKWIFINPNQHNDLEFKEILVHEITHVKELHSFDSLISEIMSAICWINPLAWLFRNEVRSNLEYLADQNVKNSGKNIYDYQLHLLRIATQNTNYPITNSMSISPLKKRIMMMNKKQPPKIKLVAYTLLAPVATLLLVVNNAEAITTNLSTQITNLVADNVEEFEIKGQILGQNDKPLSGTTVLIKGTALGTKTDKNGEFTIMCPKDKKIVTSHVGYKSNEFLISGEGNVVITLQPEVFELKSATVFPSKDEIQEKPALKNLQNELIVVAHRNNTPIEDGKEVFQIVEKMPTFPQGNLNTWLAQNVKYPANAAKNKVEGKVYIQFVIEKDGTVSNAKVLRSVDPELDAEALRVVSLMPKWTPGAQHGEPVSVYYTLPINFSLGTPKKSTQTSDKVFQIVEKMPIFPQGSIQIWLAKNVKYPAGAVKNNIEGKVYVQFVIEKDGEVSNTKVLNSVAPELDAEAIRVVSLMPKWIPGTQRGEAVRVYYTLPISFRLEGTNKSTQNRDEVFKVVEKMPQFPDGDLNTFIKKHLRHSTESEKIERVDAQFIVEKDGSISNVKVKSNGGTSLDTEMRRVISLMPKWIPGTQHGEAVRVQYALCFSFMNGVVSK